MIGDKALTRMIAGVFISGTIILTSGIGCSVAGVGATTEVTAAPTPTVTASPTPHRPTNAKTLFGEEPAHVAGSNAQGYVVRFHDGSGYDVPSLREQLRDDCGPGSGTDKADVAECTRVDTEWFNGLAEWAEYYEEGGR